jgi:hypothetical protein
LLLVETQRHVIVGDCFRWLAYLKLHKAAAIQGVGIIRPELQRLIAVSKRRLGLANLCARPATVVERFGVLGVEPQRLVEVRYRTGKLAILGVELTAPVIGGGVIRILADIRIEMLDCFTILEAGKSLRWRRSRRGRLRPEKTRRLPYMSAYTSTG